MSAPLGQAMVPPSILAERKNCISRAAQKPDRAAGIRRSQLRRECRHRTRQGSGTPSCIRCSSLHSDSTWYTSLQRSNLPNMPEPVPSRPATHQHGDRSIPARAALLSASSDRRESRSFQIEDRHLPLVFRMNVRRVMLVKEHPNDYSEEPAYLWHRPSPFDLKNTGRAVFNLFFFANFPRQPLCERSEAKSAARGGWAG